jgi:hypothetical protein
MKRIEYWEFGFGFYFGVLFGYRYYEQDNSEIHVLYVPFFDFSLTIQY